MKKEETRLEYLKRILSEAQIDSDLKTVTLMH